MGILDLNNPQGMGLLSLGLRLMSTPGKFGTALGQAGMGALGDMQQIQAQNDTRKSRDLQQQMLMMQLEQAKALQEAQRAQAQRQAKDEGLMRSMLTGTPVDGMGPPSMTPQLDPGAFVAGGGSVQGLPAMLQLQQALGPKPADYKVVGGSLVKVGPEGVSEAYRAPTDNKPTPGIQEYEYAKAQGYRGTFADFKRQNAAAGASQISFGSPIPAINPATNKPEFVRPDNKGGMTFTGVSPPPQNRDTKLPAELQRMQIAGDTMSTLLDEYEKMLDKHNPRDPLVQMNPTVRADMQSLKRNLELQFKELQALGALAGPDIEIMRQALSDPFSVQGAFFGPQGLKAQVRRARDLVKTRSDAVIRSQGRDDSPSQQDSDPLGLR